MVGPFDTIRSIQSSLNARSMCTSVVARRRGNIDSFSADGFPKRTDISLACFPL